MNYWIRILAFVALGQALFAEPVVTISKIVTPMVIVEWDANPPAERVAGYYLYVWEGYAPGPAQRIKVPSATRKAITGVIEGRLYRVAVSAYNVDGLEGQASQAIDVVPGPGTTVLSVVASEGTLQKSSNLLHWDAVPSPYLTSERAEPRAFFRILTGGS